jgi:FkbM family methyltransferase
MTLWEQARTLAWYKIRRRTRRSRNQSVRTLFVSAVEDLKPGDICIDCGANVGAITLQFAEKGAIVHAFEPDPDAFRALQSNVGHLRNVVLHNAAVGVGDQRVALYRGARAPEKRGGISEGSSIVQAKSNVSADDVIIVDQVDLATFVSSLRIKVAILKIDIEGAEVALMNDLLDQKIIDRFGSVFVETHEKQIPELRSATMRLIQRCRPFPHVYLDWW